MSDINFGKSDLQFTQLYKEYELRIAIFNHIDGRNFGIKTKLNLKAVILLDRQLTIDTCCN